MVCVLTFSHLLSHKLWLVLCVDRIQFRIGKRVRWEVHYQDVTQFTLCRGGLGWRYFAISLVAPERFDAAWPRVARERRWWRRNWRVDLALPVNGATEPPERILESALRCFHRFQAAPRTP